ncbi:MAG: hypothetical protein CMG59_03660 [Candidatus Marinimicrobia bacterium]|nr:hypothetical protein [Candidatus Neomarinimicrobiota bacterium]|tara:strand:- start:4664 stop:6199 length:1536 start_codon:yes stop_codon:yes gene_type:complete
MSDFWLKIYTELSQDDGSILMMIFVVIGLSLIFFISRRISQLKKIRKRTQLLLAIDIVIFPVIIILFSFIMKAFDIEDSSSITSTLILLSFTWFFNRFLSLFFWGQRFVDKTGEKAPKLLQNFISLIIYLLVLAFIVGYIFQKPVTSILVSTGLFATVIGFAMKDFIADVINGISLSIERPYNIGDWIEIENGKYLGKVIDITWRTTRLLSRNDSMIVVPNNRCGNMIIHNFSKPGEVYSSNYWISINSTLPPNLVQRQLLHGMQTVKNIVKDPAPRAYLADATSEPFKYNIRVWWKSYEFSYFGRDHLFKSVTESLAKVGISQTSLQWQVSKRGQLDQIQLKNVTYYDQVQKVDIFQNFSETDINLLISNSLIRTFDPNESIVNEKEDGDSLFLIISGNARVSIQKDGSEIKLGLLSPGDTFGEFSLLTGDKRSATVKAINHLECMEIPREALKSIIEKDPNLIDELSSTMARRQESNKNISEKNKKLSPKEIFDYYKSEFDKKIKKFFS